MKMTTLGLAALAAALGFILLAGCGGDDGSEQSAAAAETAFDQAFIDAMVPHHRDAIAAAEEAKAAGLSQPELVAIADAIIATQQTEIDQMLAWREEWFGSSEIDPNGADALGMSREEMGMQHDPADLSTAMDVDSAFASMMVDHHNGAIAMARMALEQGEQQEIRDLAAVIIEAQEREVAIMTPHAQAMDHS